MAVIDGVERASRVRGRVVAILGVLGAGHGVAGLWALATPLVFYEGSPLPVLPPYNEHLVRDLGALNLALAVMLVGAALRADRATVRLAAIAVLAAAVPHAAYHVVNLSQFPLVDALTQTVGTVVHVALLAVVLALSGRLEER